MFVVTNPIEHVRAFDFDGTSGVTHVPGASKAGASFGNATVFDRSLEGISLTRPLRFSLHPPPKPYTITIMIIHGSFQEVGIIPFPLPVKSYPDTGSARFFQLTTE